MARVVNTVTEYQPVQPCKTAPEMEELCCTETAPLLCCEEVVDNAWPGYSDEEILAHLGIELDERGRDSQGRYVVIERQLRAKPCGRKVVEYDLEPTNCCDEIEPMSWDGDNSAEVLPAGDSASFVVVGGMPPFRWSTSAAGTTMAGGAKSIVTYSRSVAVYADESFCGTTHITVADGCTSVSSVIRSDQGVWLDRGEGCALPGVQGQWTEIIGDVYWNEYAIQGQYKQLSPMEIYPYTGASNAEYWMVPKPGFTPRPGYDCLSGCLGDGNICDCWSAAQQKEFADQYPGRQPPCLVTSDPYGFLGSSELTAVCRALSAGDTAGLFSFGANRTRGWTCIEESGYGLYHYPLWFINGGTERYFEWRCG